MFDYTAARGIGHYNVQTKLESGWIGIEHLLREANITKYLKIQIPKHHFKHEISCSNTQRLAIILTPIMVSHS